MVFVFLWLNSLSMIISRSIHVLYMALFHSFLCLSSIPLCMCVCIHIYIYMYVYTHLYHIFFIHSFVIGHLGWICVLPMVNSITVFIGVHVSFWIIVLVSSVTQLCPTLFNPMDCSMPGFPVHHQLPELAQTHVHQVSDAIQPSHPLSSLYPPAFNLSQHQGLFKWVGSLH